MGRGEGSLPPLPIALIEVPVLMYFSKYVPAFP